MCVGSVCVHNHPIMIRIHPVFLCNLVKSFTLSQIEPISDACLCDVTQIQLHLQKPDLSLNVGAPQGCVLSPLLYSLYTRLRVLSQIHVYYQISNNDETAYLDEVERLTSWCQDNCLSLNVSKTKELIVDFRKRQQRPYTPLMISGTPVERVSSFKYLGVNISEDLTWTTHIQTQVKKAVRLAERILGSSLPSLQDIYLKRYKSRAVKIIKDSNHPGNRLFILLPSGKRFRSLMAKTES